VAELQALLALAPGDVPALGVLGGVLLDRGELDAALEAYRTAQRLAPEDFEANTGLGVIALRRGEPAVALHHFELARRADPDSVLAASNFGATLRALDRHGEAIPVLESVVARDSRHVMALCNLGAVYLDLGRAEAALACFERAVASNPRAAEAHVNCACALCDMGRYAEAVPVAERALAIVPGMPTALSVLGRARSELGQADRAIAACREAIVNQPANSEAHWNLALPLLRLGQYEEGWREFEWRFLAQRRRLRPMPNDLPRWNGEPLNGKTLLVCWEQGFGDSIHFARYLPMLAGHGARILLQVQAPLRRLFEGLAGVAEFVELDATAVAADYQVAMMSLPHRFGTTLDTIPNAVPYLRAPQGAASLLPPATGRRRIGLAWSGSPAQSNNRFRSVPFAALAPLLAMPEIDWVNLQVGSTAAERAMVPDAARMLDPTPRLGDFADTAALMQELDLVITIDTSVAHLAGALARPVWLMLSHTCCWRYLLDRSDSPWYPTARLFRQPSPGDWGSVVSTIRAALEESAP
jgi:tetratricopeptide (TPR) repeat protein